MPTDRYGKTSGQKHHAKESRRAPKYKSVCIDINECGTKRCMIIPVITGATGIVTKGLKKNVEAIQENIQQINYKRQLYLEHHT